MRITPPRAGTFIYHTHLHDYRQLSSGLYGPLIVTEPGETFDPATDHVVVLGRARRHRGIGHLLEDADSAVDQRRARAAMGVARRRAARASALINITPDDVLHSVAASGGEAPDVEATDQGRRAGARGGRQPVPGAVRIAVGETYDFEYETPAGRATLWLEVRSSSGKWQAQARVTVK